MSKRANPKMVGLFVLGALALAVVAVLAFGGADLFTPRKVFVAYFPGSVKGLSVGAPVSFRGVQIGHVSDVLVTIAPKTKQIEIAVLMTVRPDRIRYGGKAKEIKSLKFEELLKEGLRAQLVVQSLVTGQLMIELDFHPDAPLRLVGGMPQYPEIPTVPSDLDAFLARFKELPIDKVAHQVTEILDAVQQFVQSQELKNTLESLRSAARHLDSLLGEVRRQIVPLLKNTDTLVGHSDQWIRELHGGTRTTVASVNQTLERIRRLVDNVNRDIPSIRKRLEDTSTLAQKALVSTKNTVDKVGVSLAENGPIMANLKRTLVNIAAAAHSLRVLADYLQRHPEALIQGKGGYGKRK